MHPMDATLFAATPLLPVPRFGTLPTLAEGHKRLLGSAQGLYVEARSAAWDVCARIATVALPYGEMMPRLRCPAGAIPLALVNAFVAQAQANPAREIAAAIVLSDTGFALVWPTIESSSGAHVRYIDTDIDEDRLVIDLHSHGHHDAIFSGTDDASDRSRRGPHLSMVVGRCHTAHPTMSARMCLSPYLLPMSLTDLKAQQVFA